MNTQALCMRVALLLFEAAKVSLAVIKSMLVSVAVDLWTEKELAFVWKRIRGAPDDGRHRLAGHYQG